MTSTEIRQKFIKFFEDRGHKVLPSASLVPENDPTVLFTTAGMQQFKRFYLYPTEAPAPRITTIQKCVRTGDIDEVGDATHLTFFEMLGNFSFGYQARTDADLTQNNADNTRTNAEESISHHPVIPAKAGIQDNNQPYFKEESIKWAWEFLTEVLKVDKSRLSATYFAGDRGIPEDAESKLLLQKITGLEPARILGTDFSETFWSLGTEGSPGGPTVEFYIDGLEIWNLVFNEYVMQGGKYQPSELKGVDTGMGLERLVAVLQGKADVYETDLFEPIIKKIEEISGKKYSDSPKEFRIIADHLRSAVMMIADGVVPLNKDQGYILRRLIRRAVVKGKQLGINNNFTSLVITSLPVIPTSPSVIPTEALRVEGSLDQIKNELEKEESKFRKTLENGLKIIESRKEFSGQVLFDLYQSYGIPFEVTIEEANRLGHSVSNEAMKQSNNLMREHQLLSRTASAGKFKGGLADNKEETTRLHTAAHLLLAALRQVLSNDVNQKGSNITEERLRFDFNWPDKLTPEQLSSVEKLVNDWISQKLLVEMEELSIADAKKSGASGVFDDRYGEKVKVYTIGLDDNVVSREICGGPHVKNTSELGHFKITKEESSSAGIRRIKAILESILES